MLATAGVVAYGVWDYRRKIAARDAASKARFDEMFKMQGAAAPAKPESAPPPPPPATAVPASVPTTVTTPPVSPPIAVSAPGRFLGKTETLVYRLLQTGLPDHEIFANVTLSSVVAASGGGSQGEQQARRLSQYQLDFVVCERDLRIVAAVEVEAGGGADAIGMRHFKEECLKAAGIRLVWFDAAALPRRQEIRALLGMGPLPPSAH
jgi:hypothetical protein